MPPRADAGWVLFTMDETIGIFPTRAAAVKHILNRSIGPVAARRLRRGAYEYRVRGEDRTYTFWVMTKPEALKDGWVDMGEILSN